MIPRAIVTDIEGTTSSIAFVAQVLFPYARARLGDYVLAHPAPVVEAVPAQVGDPALSTQDCIDHLLAWHDADLKIGPLKQVQGLIWAQGYADGTLSGHVYPGAAAGLRRWHGMGVALAVYSSGSVAAQHLLFGHSDHGDLRPLFSGWFDTAVGAKREAASYRTIAQALDLPECDILFLSDITQELDAAREAGFATTLLARDGQSAGDHPAACDFDTIPKG